MAQDYFVHLQRKQGCSTYRRAIFCRFVVMPPTVCDFSLGVRDFISSACGFYSGGL